MPGGQRCPEDGWVGSRIRVAPRWVLESEQVRACWQYGAAQPQDVRAQR